MLLNGFYLVAFRNASYIHDYAGFYLVAPVALMAGVALDHLADWKARRHLGLAIALLIVYLMGLAVYTQVLGLVDDLPAYSQRISEIVDAPNWVVSFYFPRVVFA